MRMISGLGMMMTAALASLAFGGCAAPSTDDGLDPGETDDVASDGKADGASTLAEGNYSLSPDYGAYWGLSVDADDQFTLHGGCKPNPNGPSCFAIIQTSGHYRLTKSGSTKYVRLYNDLDDDALIVKFKYVVESYGAKLTDTSTGDVYKATN